MSHWSSTAGPSGSSTWGRSSNATSVRTMWSCSSRRADRVAIGLSHAQTLDAERAVRVRVEHVQAIVDAGLAHLELDALLGEPLNVYARSSASTRSPSSSSIPTGASSSPARRLVSRRRWSRASGSRWGRASPAGSQHEGRPIGLPDVDPRRGCSNPPASDQGRQVPARRPARRPASTSRACSTWGR